MMILTLIGAFTVGVLTALGLLVTIGAFVVALRKTNE